MIKRDSSSLLLLILLGLNIVDILLHIAVGQPEPLRISGNLLVIFGAALTYSQNRRLPLALGLCGYILLNTWFVVTSGIGVAGALFIAATALVGIYVLRPVRSTQQK